MKYLKLVLFYFLFIVPAMLIASVDKTALRDTIKSVPIAEKLPLLVNLANSFTFATNDSAIMIFQEAITLATEHGNKKVLGSIFQEYGYLLYRLGQMDSSLFYLKNALKISEQHKDSLGIALTLNRMGNVFWYLDKQITAKEYYEKALKIHIRMQNDQEIGRTYNNLGNMYQKWGDYEKALNLFLKASEYYKKSNYSEGLAWLNFSITRLYKKIADYKNALASINTSLEIYKDLVSPNGDSSGIMICYGQLGDIYRLLGDYEKGLKYNLEALRMRRKTGVISAIADGLMGVGQIYYETGDYKKSIDYMKQSKKLRENAKINSGVDTNLKYLGYAYYKLGHTNTALNYLKQGLNVARRLNQLFSQKEILGKISQIYEENNYNKLALEYYHKLEVVKDSLNESELEKQLAIIKLQNEIKEKYEENKHLTLDNKIQILQIEQSKTLRNFLYLGILVCVIILILIAYLYKNKINDNELLKNKNEEINKAHKLLENEISERIELEKQREKLILDLKDSLSKIKTLRGLIPICSNCKKIRNDKGYYEKLEKYFGEHTEAQFSHGICPECTEKLYPDYLNKDKKKDQNISSE